MMKQISKERNASPSSFFRESRFTRDDASLLFALGTLSERGLRTVETVAHRCSHGFPQVLRCSPLMCGQPFPTSFWLVCPYLMRIIGGIEAKNGIAAMQDVLRSDPRALYDYHRLHASIRLASLPDARKRFLRQYRKPLYRALTRGGIGGIAYRSGAVYVKCLHLQTASYLALGFHPAARFLEEQIGSWACRGGSCLSDKKKEAV